MLSELLTQLSRLPEFKVDGSAASITYQDPKRTWLFTREHDDLRIETTYKTSSKSTHKETIVSFYPSMRWAPQKTLLGLVKMLGHLENIDNESASHQPKTASSETMSNNTLTPTSSTTTEAALELSPSELAMLEDIVASFETQQQNKLTTTSIKSNQLTAKQPNKRPEPTKPNNQTKKKQKTIPEPLSSIENQINNQSINLDQQENEFMLQRNQLLASIDTLFKQVRDPKKWLAGLWELSNQPFFTAHEFLYYPMNSVCMKIVTEIQKNDRLKNLSPDEIHSQITRVKLPIEAKRWQTKLKLGLTTRLKDIIHKAKN